MEYKTRDFYQAAALKTCQIPFIRLEPSQDKKYFYFIFNDVTDTAQETVRLYRERMLFTNTADFVSAVKEFKQLLFSMKDEKREISRE